MAAGPRPPAKPHPSEAGAGAAAEADVAEGNGSAEAAAEEPKVGDVVMGEAEVVDLVPVEDKPAEKPKA